MAKLGPLERKQQPGDRACQQPVVVILLQYGRVVQEAALMALENGEGPADEIVEEQPAEEARLIQVPPRPNPRANGNRKQEQRARDGNPFPPPPMSLPPHF